MRRPPSPRLTVAERLELVRMAFEEGDTLGAASHLESLRVLDGVQLAPPVAAGLTVTVAGPSVAESPMPPDGDPVIPPIGDRRHAASEPWVAAAPALVPPPPIALTAEADQTSAGTPEADGVPATPLEAEDVAPTLPEVEALVAPPEADVPPEADTGSPSSTGDPSAPDVRRVASAHRSGVESSAGGGRNGTNVRTLSAAAGASFRPLADALELRGAAERVQLSQAGYIRQMTTTSIDVDSLISGSHGRIGMGGQLSLEDAGPVLGGGFAVVELRPVRFAAVGIHASYAPAWSFDRPSDPLAAIRMTDIARMDPSLTRATLRGDARLRWGAKGEAYVAGGVSGFSDGNRRTFGYGHLRIPLYRQDLRLAIEPNAYGEVALLEETEGFFNPVEYGLVGLRGWIGFERGRVSATLEANPHWFGYPGISGIGVTGSLAASLGLGPADVVANLEFHEQAINSYVWTNLGLRLPLS